MPGQLLHFLILTSAPARPGFNVKIVTEVFDWTEIERRGDV